MNGCGCNYWKELIKSAWGLATTSVRAAKTKDGTRYPDGDGVLDISDIAGGEGTVTGVNGKQPDAQGNVTVGSGDIATPDGTVQGDLEELGTNLASEISARASGDEALQTAVEGKQDALTSSQQAAVDSGITKDKVTSFSMTTQNLTRLSNRVDTLESDITTAEGNIETLGTQIGTVDTKVDGKQDKLTAGANVQITGNTISATDTKYTLPTASSTILGGVKVGTGLTITDGVLNATGTTAGVSSVNGKTGAVTIGAPDVLSTAQLNAANSGITTSKVSTYDGYSTSKQNTLSTAQLNAANSGITSAKVSTYDGYATAIAGKQDKLTPGSNITISGNTISATDTKYTLPTASSTVLGGVKVGSGLSISNGVLSATGGGGGGASLPENGYYWEKITSNNWPNDWTNTDIIMISPSSYQYLTNKSWDESITYSPVFSVTGSRQSWVITKIYTYTNTIYYNSISDGGITFNTLDRVEEPSYWNEKSPSRILVQLKFTAFNGTGTSQHIISNMTYPDVVRSGLYRLRKFSS